MGSVKGAAAGFTLLELVVVLVIMAVIAVVAMPRMPSGLFDGTPDVAGVQDELLGHLRQARSWAMVCGGENKEVQVDINGGEWRIWSECRADDELAGPTAGDGGVTVTGDSFHFRYPLGDLRDAAGNYPAPVVLQISTSGGETRHICVSPQTGAIRRGGC